MTSEINLLSSGYILLLDDSPRALELIGDILGREGFITAGCSSVEEAELFVSQRHPIAALIDLYLLGDTGAELSNNFIQNTIVPNCIPYGRVTSAPRDVPQNLRGELVYDKREITIDPSQFVRDLKVAFGL